MKMMVKVALGSVDEDEKEHGSGVHKHTTASVMNESSKKMNAVRCIRSRRRSTSCFRAALSGRGDERTLMGLDHLSLWKGMGEGKSQRWRQGYHGLYCIIYQ